MKTNYDYEKIIEKYPKLSKNVRDSFKSNGFKPSVEDIQNMSNSPEDAHAIITLALSGGPKTN